MRLLGGKGPDVSRSTELARHRLALVARSRALREDLAVDGARVASRLVLVDKGVSLVRSLAHQPLLMAGATAFLLALRPLKAMKWAARGALLFSVARRLFEVLGRGGSRSAEAGEPPTFI